jgi:hypothetical protein
MGLPLKRKRLRQAPETLTSSELQLLSTQKVVGEKTDRQGYSGTPNNNRKQQDDTKALF